jgi:hypothetical protein
MNEDADRIKFVKEGGCRKGVKKIGGYIFWRLNSYFREVGGGKALTLFFTITNMGIFTNLLIATVSPANRFQ